MSNIFFEYYNPVRIVYGTRVLEGLGEYIVRHVGGNLALILLDTKTFLGCRDGLTSLTESLKNNGIEYVVYDKIPLNPRLEDLEEAVEVCRESYADIIIGFGDWNAVNSAKITVAAISVGGRIEKIWGALDKVKATMPVVTVPSSHGVGLDFSGYTILAGNDRLRYVYSQALYPKLSILDPYVALKTPLNVAVLSVVYALANALSALVSVDSNPLSNLYASASIETITSNHRLLLEKPDNLEVRGKLLQASMLAGKAFDITGPSILHIIAHTIALIHRDIYPGRIMAAILSSWLRQVLPRAGNKEIIARVLGVGIEDTPSRVEELLEEMKASTRLSDIGLEENDIQAVLKIVDENLRPDVKKILEDSL